MKIETWGFQVLLIKHYVYAIKYVHTSWNNVKTKLTTKYG